MTGVVVAAVWHWRIIVPGVFTVMANPGVLIELSASDDVARSETIVGVPTVITLSALLVPPNASPTFCPLVPATVAVPVIRRGVVAPADPALKFSPNVQMYRPAGREPLVRMSKFVAGVDSDTSLDRA
jgi:hypothetical protein